MPIYGVYSGFHNSIAGPSQGGPNIWQISYLTLSRPGGTHYPHPVLLAPPPKFQTLGQPFEVPFLAALDIVK